MTPVPRAQASGIKSLTLLGVPSRVPSRPVQYSICMRGINGNAYWADATCTGFSFGEHIDCDVNAFGLQDYKEPLHSRCCFYRSCLSINSIKAASLMLQLTAQTRLDMESINVMGR